MDRVNRRNPRAQEEGGLGEEIRLLRRALRQAAALLDGAQEAGDLLRVLDHFSKASTRLGTLLKTQKALSGGAGAGADMRTALNEALAEVLREMGG